MWVGLILGVLLAVLGLSGSLIVYDQEIADLLSPPPYAVTAGTPLPLTMLADTAREEAAAQGLDGGQMQIILPQKKNDAVVVRMGGISPMGVRPEAGDKKKDARNEPGGPPSRRWPSRGSRAP